MKRAIAAALLTLGLGLAGCADNLEPLGPTGAVTPPPPPPPPPTVETGAIVGLGVFHTHTGRTVSCAGLSVAATLESPAGHDRMLAIYGSAFHAFEPVAAAKAKAARLGAPPPITASGQCDGDGRFRLTDLQAGAYFLLARVRVFSEDHPPTDAVVLQRVVLRPGETRSLQLSE